jgi:aldose 1-epimerase
MSEEPVQVFVLAGSNGLRATITNLGGIVMALEAPDRAGNLADLVLGFDDPHAYAGEHPYFGAIVGRVANRIHNARFELGGASYQIAANDPPHHLHGGRVGFDKAVWIARHDGTRLELEHTSPAGDEGYPGTLRTRAVYRVTDSNELVLEMQAETDQLTLVNLAHHSYFNLAGHAGGTILDHELTLFADDYTPGSPVPRGEIEPVRNTPFDFTQPKKIGKDLQAAGAKPVGYDHNFVVRQAGPGPGDPFNALRPVARLEEPRSGRVLEVSADQPGVQLYSGNFLDGSIAGKGGVRYVQHAALCLESQAFPNAVNVPAWRSSVVLEPGERYQHTLVLKFSAR